MNTTNLDPSIQREEEVSSKLTTSVKKKVEGLQENETKQVQQRLLYEKQLQDFLSSPNESITFPSSLSSSLRKLIHEVSC